MSVLTNTDLIKALAVSPTRGRHSIAKLLMCAVSSSHMDLLHIISEAAKSHGIHIYLVGGFVRDLLLARPSVDYDVVVEGDAIKFANELATTRGGQVTEHRRFGTAKWYLPAVLMEETGLQALDLASARTEYYPRPSALPEVEFSSIRMDLKRRDFTINTLAVSLNAHQFGELLDHWGGLKDLEGKRLRVLHPLSFEDDPTRALRAVRLAQRIGFQIDQGTAELIDGALPMLANVSGDRIRHEIESIFSESAPENILAHLDEIGGFGSLHSALVGQADAWLEKRFIAAREHALKDELPEIYFGLWLYRLEQSDIEDICRLLTVNAETMRVCKQIQHVKTRLSDLKESSKPSRVVCVLDGLGHITLEVIALAEDKHVRSQIQCYHDKYRHVQPTIGGADLRARGLVPGPIIGHILSRVRNAWLDGEITDTITEENLVRELVAAEEE